jgi:hypothetical protein
MISSARKLRAITIGVTAVSVLASLVARFVGRPDLRVPLGIPALLLTGWSFFGFLVTLDDDAPGGWSNPEGSRKFWYRSLKALATLLAVFLATCWIVVF